MQVQGILREGDLLAQSGRKDEGARKYQEAYSRLEKLKNEAPDRESWIVEQLMEETSEKLGLKFRKKSDGQNESPGLVPSLLSGPGRIPSSIPSNERLRILEIEYASNRDGVALNEDKIRQNMRSHWGGIYSPQWVDEDISNLYASGDFKNIQIHASSMRRETGENGVRLVVCLDPKVPLAEWEAERIGENGARESHLSIAVKDLPTSYFQIGRFLDAESLHRQAKTWEEIYRKNGFYDVLITPKVTPLANGQDKLVMEIREGKRGFIRRIQFLGNKQIESGELKKLVKLKPRNWFSNRDISDCMDGEQLERDLAKLKNFYRKKGFLDIQIEASVKANDDDMSPIRKKKVGETGNGLALIYKIQEGDRYGVEKIAVEGMNSFTEADLLKELREKSRNQEVFDQFDLTMVKADGLLRGHPFSELGLQASVETLQGLYGKNGFREVRIETRVQGTERKGALAVSFKIEEGEKLFVDRVQILGNTQVPDRMIRSKVELVPGDIFDTSKEKQSREKILQMGAFSRVETYAEETDRPNFQNLLIKVEEKPKELSFGIGAGYFWEGKSERSVILAYHFPYLITLNYSKDWDWVCEKMLDAMKSKIGFYMNLLKIRAFWADPADVRKGAHT